MQDKPTPSQSKTMKRFISIITLIADAGRGGPAKAQTEGGSRREEVKTSDRGTPRARACDSESQQELLLAPLRSRGGASGAATPLVV
jgi:hypothetical protein